MQAVDKTLSGTLVWQYLDEPDPKKAEAMLEGFSRLMPDMDEEYIDAVRQLSVEHRLRNCAKDA